MSEPAVSVHGLGKRYRLGESQQRYNTLRDRIAAGVTRRLRSIRSWRRPPSSDPLTFWALRDVSFDVAPGEVVGIIGRNGAGKSTLLKILSRITEPTVGEARIHGRVGSLLEVGTGFHTELTGRENIYLSGAILGMRRSEIARKFDEMVAFAEVESFIDTPVKHYSSGMYLRLAFAVAAHLEPEIMMVDEVLAVGDIAFQKKCLGKMNDVSREGRTVLFVSHNLSAVQGLCSRVVWLHDGTVLEDGPTSDVIGRYARSPLSSATIREWSTPEDAPGNSGVRLRRASVRREGGDLGDLIDVRTPFRLEFDYWNLVPGARLALSVNVYNEHGVLVFNVGSTEAPAPLPAGLIRETGFVPGDLMNDGIYTLELMVVQDQNILLHRERDLLVWEVADSPDLRAGWYGKWHGAVRPILSWTTEHVPLPDAAGITAGVER